MAYFKQKKLATIKDLAIQFLENNSEIDNVKIKIVI